jgi:hypothetical protein
MAQEPNYSLEVIRRYREMDRNGGFHREIQGRTPVTLQKDRVVLACGHSSMRNAVFLDETPRMGVSGFRCDECAEEWLNKVAGEEQPS